MNAIKIFDLKYNLKFVKKWNKNKNKMLFK